MRYKKILLVLFLSLGVCFSTTSCKDDYDRGYSEGKWEGYSDGKETGYESGYSDGKETGYESGYSDGTSAFIKNKTLPSMGLIFVALITIIWFVFLFKIAKKPALNIIQNISSNLDEKRERSKLNKELKRLPKAYEEQARLKAKIISATLLKQVTEVIIDEEYKTELESIRQNAESNFCKMQLENIVKFMQEFQDAIEASKVSKNLSESEKSELWENFRTTLSGHIGEPNE